MKYTTIESIYLKIKTRLNLDVSTFGSTPSSMFPGVSDSVTSTPIDSDLVEVVIEEQEYYIDLVLAQVYKLPLISNEHYILRDIADSLVIAELLTNYFQGIGLVSLASDTSSYSTQLKTNAYQKLRSLTVGRDIEFPFITSEIDKLHKPATLVLPGEILITEPPNIIMKRDVLRANRNYTPIHDKYADPRNPNVDTDWLVQDSSNYYHY